MLDQALARLDVAEAETGRLRELWTDWKRGRRNRYEGGV